MPSDMSPKDVIAAAASRGLIVSENYVYKLRLRAGKHAGKARASVRRRPVNATTPDVTPGANDALRRAIAEVEAVFAGSR